MNYNEYDECRLCPRKCRVNRNNGEMGVCGQTSSLKIGRASLHLWEEPCISGENGSGTVFFSGCSLKCCYCQNFRLSRGEEGVCTEQDNLSQIFLNLQEEGAHNINLVTGEHFAPQIKSAVKKAREDGLKIPVVLNSSGYVTEETLEYLSDIVDIYLVDFKYMDKHLAKNYSGAEDSPLVAKTALRKMYSIVGAPSFDSEGILKKGVVVRHLCLPGCSEDSKNVIGYIFDNYGENVILSIMSQYTPFGNCEKHPELCKKLTAEEYDEVIDFCLEKGIENAYVQEGEAASESFIPAFDGKGVVF